MKNLLLVLLFFVVYSEYSQKNDEKVAALLNNQNFFELKKRYPSLKSQTSEYLQLIAEFTINTFFNAPECANQQLRQLFATHEAMTPEEAVAFSMMAANNEIQLQHYAKAASIYAQLIEQLPDNFLQSVANQHDLSVSLKDVAEMSVTFPNKKTQIIPLKQDELSFSTLPVSSPHCRHALDFIVDFGARYSIIEEKHIDSLGIILLKDSVLIGTALAIDTYAKLGIAPEIFIGNIKLTNVVFLVSPNKIMSALHATMPNYETCGAIGVPVWRALNYLEFYNGQLTVYQEKKIKKEPANMMLYNNEVYVQVFTKEDSLCLIFDSGMNSCTLNHLYYEKHHAQLQNLPSDSAKMASYNTDFETIYCKKITNFSFHIGRKEIVLPSIMVFTSETKNYSLPSMGILGNTIFTQNHKIKFDFQNMRMEIK